MLQLLAFLARIIPLIHAVAATTETLIPGAKQGAAKLEAATSIIEGILPAIGATLEQVQQLRAPVQAAINSIVAVANKAGTLKVTGAPPAAP